MSIVLREEIFAIFNKNPTSESVLEGMISPVKDHTMLSMLHSSENVSQDTMYKEYTKG